MSQVYYSTFLAEQWIYLYVAPYMNENLMVLTYLKFPK